MSDNTSGYTFYPVRTKLVGRANQMAKLMHAINSEDPWALYLTGEGGIGKTRIFEEVYEECANSKRRIHCTPIMDLYHPEFHSAEAIQATIATQMAAGKRFFKKFIKLHQEYLQLEKELGGSAAESLNQLAQERDRQFLADYQALAKNGRVVLLFDTMEQIEYDTDIVQQLCQIETLTSEAKEWLTSSAPKLPNTTILFAGRSRPGIEQQIRAAFKKEDWSFQEILVETLPEANAIELAEDILAQRSVAHGFTAAEKQWLFEITGRKPILLGLTLQYIYNFDRSNLHRGLEHLRAVVYQPNSSESDQKYRLSKTLIGQLIGKAESDKDIPLNEYALGMHFMFLARKGMDDDLLRSLTTDEADPDGPASWNDRKRADFLSEMANNVLFKRHGERIFLHDELYDMYDRTYLDETSTTQYLENIAGYYRNKLEQKELSYRELQELRVSALYYELMSAPEQGYAKFREWAFEAIWLHFRATDLRLRDELLRFLNRYGRADAKFADKRIQDQLSPEEVDRNSAVNWVERYIAEGQNKKAYEVAQTVRNSSNAIFDWEKIQDPTYKARLLKAWAEASVYLGQYEEAERIIQEGISILDHFTPPASLTRWITQTYGELFNRYGYLNRVEGRYAKAIPWYQKAISEFRKNNLDYLSAQTKNNLAYILAETGESETGEILVKEAIGVWEKLGVSHRLALSLNTYSLVLCAKDLPIAACEEAERALNIFTQLNEQRGVILAKIALGRARRKQGNLWKQRRANYTKDACHQFFKGGKDVLTEVLLSPPHYREASKQWELYNELGSLYCDWAWLDRIRNQEAEAAMHYRLSIQNQVKALEIARQSNMRFQEVDSLDDLAQAHGDRALFELRNGNREEFENHIAQAKNFLADAESSVEVPYRDFKSNQPFKHEAGAPYWLVWAKSNMWRGVWMYREIQYQDKFSLQESAEPLTQAFKHLVVAIAFFKRYEEHNVQYNRAGTYVLELLRGCGASYAWAEEQITHTEQELNTDLTFLKTWLQVVL